MKSLYLIRHAKSNQDLGAEDFERPLNERGKKDAPAMGSRMQDRGIKIDTFISSPAKRARQTAKLFAKGIGFDEDAIEYVPTLYLADPMALRKAIEGIDDRYGSATIFAHNPGITQIANLLTNIQINDMPTCAVFAVSIRTDRWVDFMQAEKEYLFFDYPKRTDD